MIFLEYNDAISSQTNQRQTTTMSVTTPLDTTTLKTLSETTKLETTTLLQELFGCAVGSNCAISLKTFQNKFIVAEDDGTANANGEYGDFGTIFVVTFIDGDKVQLKGNQGKYLVAENDGTVNANRDVADTWETWTVEDRGTGLAFKSFHGKYLVADVGFKLNANRDNPGTWQIFKVVQGE